MSLPSLPDLLAEKLQTRSILTLHLVSFQGVRSEAANYLGGTIYPVVLGGTAQAIAKERLEKLKQLLEDEKEGL